MTLRPFQQHFLLADFVIIILLGLGQPSLSAFTVFSNQEQQLISATDVWNKIPGLPHQLPRMSHLLKS